MRRRSVVVLVTAVSALSAAVGIGLLQSRSSAKPSARSELSAPPAGREAVLHVSWHERSTARLPPGSGGGLNGDGTLTGELDLEADLALARERTTEGGDAVRAELRDVRASHVVVSGQEVLRSDDEGKKSLEQRPIHLVLEDGKIARVLVDQDATSLPVQLTESVARQVLLAAPPDGAPKAFEREEKTPAGTMRVKYEARQGAGAGAGAYARTVVGAVALENLPDTCESPCRVRARGEGEVRFEPGDAIASLTEKREIHAGKEGSPAMLETTASFEARRVREGDANGDALDPAKLASKLPGEPFESAADHRASLARLSQGATIDEVLGGISQAAAAGARGLPKGWLVRSTAFLELHPELLDEVAIRFQDEGLGARGRLAVLDLLAATGGDQAQAVLLKTLDTAAAREGEERLQYVQRLMLVQAPNAATARELRARFGRDQGGDAQMAYAEAHALGSVASKLAARGSGAEAKAAVDALASALDEAKTPDATAAYLSALGNAGDPRQVGRIARHAGDQDASVRRSVASALRKSEDAEAKKTLVSLAKDPDPEVEVEALDSISEHAIDPAEQRDLAALLDTPQLAGPAEAQLTSILLRQGPPSPEVRGSLQHLLARTEDPRLAAQIRFALEAASRAD
jgi:hypothetical protein